MLIKNLKERKRELENLITQIQTWLSKVPNMRLRFSHGAYYIIKDDNDAMGVRTEDKNVIRTAAQRQYCLKVLKIAEEELKKIDKFLEFEEKEPLGLVYSNLSKDRQELVTPFEMTIQESISAWLSKKEASLPIRPGDRLIKTRRGDMVRSSSEMKIADALFRADIPYKTDVTIITKENRFYSVDFEIKSPSTGKIYYWEHLGMMDKDFYIGKAIEKLTDYSRVGIVCGKNLILTLEDEQHKIDEEIIRKIVKEVLA